MPPFASHAGEPLRSGYRHWSGDTLDRSAVWSIFPGKRIFWKVGDTDSGWWRKGKLTAEVVEGQRLVQAPEIFQLLPSPGNWIWPRKHTLVRKYHLPQLRRCGLGMRVVEERVKMENASGDFRDGETEFRVKAEDVTDEFVSF